MSLLSGQGGGDGVALATPKPGPEGPCVRAPIPSTAEGSVQRTPRETPAALGGRTFPSGGEAPGLCRVARRPLVAIELLSGASCNQGNECLAPLMF